MKGRRFNLPPFLIILNLFPIAEGGEQIEDDKEWRQVEAPPFQNELSFSYCGVDFETYYTSNYSLANIHTCLLYTSDAADE